MTVNSPELASVGLPYWPLGSMPGLAELLAIEKRNLEDIMFLVYPHHLMLGREGVKTIKKTLKKFEIRSSNEPSTVESIEALGNSKARIKFSNGTQSSVPVGPLFGSSPAVTKSSSANLEQFSKTDYITNNYHESILAKLIRSHSLSDLCLIGPRGCGKSIIIEEFVRRLGYPIETFVLYRDMSTRDLLQYRSTVTRGDTVWKNSPLVQAALNGHLAVLDGIHKVDQGTLTAAIQHLVHDREVTLFDGRRLIGAERFKQLMQELECTREELQSRGILEIHPNFRIVALAEPGFEVGKQQWMDSEILSMFHFVHLKPLNKMDESLLFKKFYHGKQAVAIDRLLSLAHKLRASPDSTLHALSGSLSTRQLLRIISASFVIQPTTEEAALLAIGDATKRACLSKFLPFVASKALEKELRDFGLSKTMSDIKTNRNPEFLLDSFVKESLSSVSIGKVTMDLSDVNNHNEQDGSVALIPDILFYDNINQLSTMESMLRDYSAGEHLLLVGNQGVGKNKIVDRFLGLLKKPRQYIQLHRDTTVQTLTVQPKAIGGEIIYEDSPLVKAVKRGHALVIDEADKAPTQVTCILKSLVESYSMHLSDGRKIVPWDYKASNYEEQNIIRCDPQFKLIVLANRPGYPFLGNDFYAAMGDLFSCFPIDNPDRLSEMEMLRQYGPNVPEHILEKLVGAFGELRSLSDKGVIAYPYSTREIVSIIKHLNCFPEEGITRVLGDVFDFDRYNSDLYQQLVDIISKHGIPIGASTMDIKMAQEHSLSSMSQFSILLNSSSSIPIEIKKSNIMFEKRSFNLPISSYEADKHQPRSSSFAELKTLWSLSVQEDSVFSDMTIVNSQNASSAMVAITSNPIHLHTFPLTSDKVFVQNLQPLFDNVWDPLVKIAHLSNLQGQNTVVKESLPENILIFESKSDSVFLANPLNGSVSFFGQSRNLSHSMTSIVRSAFSLDSSKDQKTLVKTLSPLNIILIYDKGGHNIKILDFNEFTVSLLNTPFKIKHVVFSSPMYLLIQSGNHQSGAGKEWFVCHNPLKDAGLHKHTLNPFQPTDHLADNFSISPLSTQSGEFSRIIGESSHVSAPATLFNSSTSFGGFTQGFPGSLTEVPAYHIPRDCSASNIQSVFLPHCGQVVSFIDKDCVSKKFLPEEIKDEKKKVNYGNSLLEIVDLFNLNIKYIPQPRINDVNRLSSWQNMYYASESKRILSTDEHSHVYSLDPNGALHEWETDKSSLALSLEEWKSLLGDSAQSTSQPLELRRSGGEVTGPKRGKHDPTGAPHVGGNTWAGGTGGRDTAGLGGKGGPYRLDLGHKVFQVPDEEKAAVPEHIKQAAKEMRDQAFKERLREIGLSEQYADVYNQFYKAISTQISSLRVILESLETSSKERQWMKHQTSGEFDDGKLVETLLGEGNVYKKRGEKEPVHGKEGRPKRLRLLVDVSGSMYRFNGYDSRLEREMEAVLMVMESFEGHQQRFIYDIYGHSGENPAIPLVESTKYPANEKDKFTVLQLMKAHAQFCLSGDTTVHATKRAIAELSKESEETFEERFLVVLSDANFDRYGIRPERFANALTSESNVNGCAIFIGSLGDQAQVLNQQLPSGKGFTCLDTKELPHILRQIFTTTILK